VIHLIYQSIYFHLDKRPRAEDALKYSYFNGISSSQNPNVRLPREMGNSVRDVQFLSKLILPTHVDKIDKSLLWERLKLKRTIYHVQYHNRFFPIPISKSINFYYLTFWDSWLGTKKKFKIKQKVGIRDMTIFIKYFLDKQST